MKTILVTGGAGYIGNVVVEKLLQKKYKVVVLDILLFGDDALKPFINNPNFVLIRGDVRHIEDVARALSYQIYGIIDLAAFVGDEMCNIDETETITINVESTKILIELSKRYGVQRFIFASTCSVYGDNGANVCSEESRISPLSLYAKTKLDSERIILNETSLITSVLRLSTVYGPSRRMRFDLVLNILTAKSIVDKKITIYGGKQWRPLIHVDDVANAFILCLEAPVEKINGQIFNVGLNEQNYALVDLAETFKHCFLNLDVNYVDDVVDSRSYKVNFDKIKSINFRTDKTINDGIIQIKKLFDDRLITNFREKKYYNINYKYL